MSGRGPPDTIYCQQCGQELRADAQFCDRCGGEQKSSQKPAGDNREHSTRAAGHSNQTQQQNRSRRQPRQEQSQSAWDTDPSSDDILPVVNDGVSSPSWESQPV
jgi:hypothetical protein